MTQDTRLMDSIARGESVRMPPSGAAESGLHNDPG